MSKQLAMKAGNTPSQNRKFYLKVIIIFYCIWLVVFAQINVMVSVLHSYDLTSFLDRKIPLIPQFVWLYVFCYVQPFLSLVILVDWHRLNRTILSFIIANLSGFIVYFTFPTAFQKPDLGNSLSESFLSMQHVSIYSGSNNFPSMHVTFSCLFYFMCRGQRLGKAGDRFMLLLMGLIMVSTIFVKMHIAPDVLAGILWAFGAWALSKNLYPLLTRADSSASEALYQMLKKLIPVTLLLGGLIYILIKCRILSQS